MNVTVDADGRVLDTEVVRGSGIEGARPPRRRDRPRRRRRSAASPTAMRRKADQLVITSRFRSRARRRLETTLSAPADERADRWTATS